MKDKEEKLNALYDYIEEQKNRADINEVAYNILQDIQDRLSEIIYN